VPPISWPTSSSKHILARLDVAVGLAFGSLGNLAETWFRLGMTVAFSMLQAFLSLSASALDETH